MGDLANVSGPERLDALSATRSPISVASEWQKGVALCQPN